MESSSKNFETNPISPFGSRRRTYPWAHTGCTVILGMSLTHDGEASC